VNITVYRLVQECLTNIVKHARASSVTVSVERAGAALHVTVADDGRGMDLNARHGGLGLLGLRERVEALSGQLELHSASGDGLRVHAWLPISAGPDAASIASLRGDAHETQGTAP
jgi:two-component system sensor histidine kinase UhpB